MTPTVLYEDNHLIAVYKPAGVLVQGDRSGDISMMDVVKKYLKEKYNKPGNVFLGLVHRLDRNVSGIVLFAKTSKGAARLSEQFRDHLPEKIYHAWVAGKMPTPKGTLKNFLKHDENQNKTDIVEEGTPNAQYAQLSYEVVEEKGNTSLVKVTLKTGRQHQIRAQLAEAGCPILGDKKYGSKTVYPDQHIALSATTLSFTTATGDERKTVTAPLPKP